MDMKKRLKIEYEIKTLPALNDVKSKECDLTDCLDAEFKREPSPACGDSVCTCKLPGNKKAFILSDGMGNGEIAAAKSRKVMYTLRKLLKQGVSPAKAIRIVNKRLIDDASLEHNAKRKTFGNSKKTKDEGNKEIFATIDLLVINENTGRANFYKMGAAKSFIVRPYKIRNSANHNLKSPKTGANEEADVINRIRIIESQALPVGIISKLVFKRTTMMLKQGDLVVMVSDGITEADKNDLEAVWLSEYLQSFYALQIDDVSLLTQNLVYLAKQKSTASKQDDISVAAIKII